jgi:hypothetical protein
MGAQEGRLGRPYALKIAPRHVVQDEQNAAGTERAREVLNGPIEICGMDERLDGDDRVEVPLDRCVIALQMEPAGILDAPPSRLAPGDPELDPAQGEAVIATPDPAPPVEHSAAEAAAGIEHPRLGREIGHLQQVIVDILEARRAAEGEACLRRDAKPLVHRERGEAIAVGEPVAELDVARQPVVVLGDLFVGDQVIPRNGTTLESSGKRR